MIRQASAIGLGGQSLGERLWSALAGLVRRPEPIEMIEQRFNYLPSCFRWRGGVWRIRQIAQIWERGGGAPSPRRYFQVICHRGERYVLFQDLRVGTWHLIPRSTIST